MIRFNWKEKWHYVFIARYFVNHWAYKFPGERHRSQLIKGATSSSHMKGVGLTTPMSSPQDQNIICTLLKNKITVYYQFNIYILVSIPYSFNNSLFIKVKKFEMYFVLSKVKIMFWSSRGVGGGQPCSC